MFSKTAFTSCTPICDQKGLLSVGLSTHSLICQSESFLLIDPLDISGNQHGIEGPLGL